MTDDELRDAVVIMRQQAANVGTQHALWEVIFDVEALLKDERTLLSRESIINQVEQALKI